ncbi:MAG: L-2-hydroxyglutarate oxidase [Saprospirales bacterium]|nr:L-2-hydroxyglutarate oxidase [Saprospirales bacterium]
MIKTDIAIVGAGIVGLATALQLSRKRPDLKICVLDKEQQVAAHQTGHNSGVIHSGNYYKPGGSKAINCRKGDRYLIDFCKEEGVPHDICGKVIVATRPEELPLLQGIFARGKANGLEGIRMLSSEEVAEKEPHVGSVAGIWVPQTGIVDFGVVARRYASLLQDQGGTLLLGHAFSGMERRGTRIIVKSTGGEVDARILVNCAGLFADKAARLTGIDPGVLIVPFRGEYYVLSKEKEALVNNLIYPVPNPNFPFLGVHYTRMMRGGIEAGPNAVLAFRREGYSRWDIRWNELLETFAYPGFRTVAANYWKTGLGEIYRSFSKRAFVKALQHLIPEIEGKDLRRGGAGVRAQAIDNQGNLVDDFLIHESPQVLNVLNAPSPAATASLAIGEMVAEKVMKQL